ncbi:hypothetical protein CVT25_004987 [Psilocybe cyanescens]|uniref:Uncharacterized protein n=1 Tax=Psilocybe cyanescens TaxID=93625 RepID=A0A409X276_PSICY|nr:hypothetical protein CVT25_004987 [Psilocybe cyanescens]
MLALSIFKFNPTSKVSSLQNMEQYTYSGGDYPRLWPIQKRPKVLLFYEPHTLHYGLDDELEWGSLSPGNGTIYLGERNEPYSISMFHQLRCIDIIRQSIVRREELATSELTRHCLSYLRQMILCRADTYADADALADYMVCEDWQAVYSEVERNQNRIIGTGYPAAVRNAETSKMIMMKKNLRYPVWR